MFKSVVIQCVVKIFSGLWYVHKYSSELRRKLYEYIYKKKCLKNVFIASFPSTVLNDDNKRTTEEKNDDTFLPPSRSTIKRYDDIISRDIVFPVSYNNLSPSLVYVVVSRQKVMRRAIVLNINFERRKYIPNKFV